ncbi:MAG TPA: NAD-dependent epimerase/dehydratase family protein, partial [Acidimicrobiales bacterium]|nr:NAD-dependent epimerase/dehydratase family protein [Acidimicrobiales bacterium]
LAALGKQATAVVHLAWHPEGRHNLAVLQNVLDAAEAIEPLQLVHLSSATVYGAWPDNPVPISEEVEPRPNPQFLYAVEKREAELLVERWGRDHPEVSLAVLRPACTVGSPGHPLYQTLARNKRPLVGADGRVVQYLHVDDLASAVVHAFSQELSGTFNVAPDAGIREELAGTLTGGPAALPLLAALGSRLRRRGAPVGARPYAEHSWAVAGDRLRQTGWQPEYTSEQALVVSDAKRHWDELPQGRRVSVVLSTAGVTLAAAGAATVLWWRRRR